MTGYVLSTKNSVYQFVTNDGKNGVLKGGRIKEEEGVKVILETDIEVGDRPSFTLLGKCTLVYDDREVSALAGRHLWLSQLNKVTKI